MPSGTMDLPVAWETPRPSSFSPGARAVVLEEMVLLTESWAEDMLIVLLFGW